MAAFFVSGFQKRIITRFQGEALFNYNHKFNKYILIFTDIF